MLKKQLHRSKAPAEMMPSCVDDVLPLACCGSFLYLTSVSWVIVYAVFHFAASEVP